MRYTVCLCVDDPEQEPVFRRWLEDNRERVTRISGNSGCGCCVLIYDLEVADGASVCPDELCSTSGWTDGGALEGAESTVAAVIAELALRESDDAAG